MACVYVYLPLDVCALSMWVYGWWLLLCVVYVFVCKVFLYGAICVCLWVWCVHVCDGDACGQCTCWVGELENMCVL